MASAVCVGAGCSAGQREASAGTALVRRPPGADASSGAHRRRHGSATASAVCVSAGCSARARGERPLERRRLSRPPRAEPTSGAHRRRCDLRRHQSSPSGPAPRAGRRAPRGIARAAQRRTGIAAMTSSLAGRTRRRRQRSEMRQRGSTLRVSTTPHSTPPRSDANSRTSPGRVRVDRQSGRSTMS